MSTVKSGHLSCTASHDPTDLPRHAGRPVTVRLRNPDVGSRLSLDEAIRLHLTLGHAIDRERQRRAVAANAGMPTTVMEVGYTPPAAIPYPDEGGE